MKIYKIAIIIATVSITAYYGISKSYGNIGGPGQNSCYHNDEVFPYAIVSGGSSTDCPDPGLHAHQSVNPPHTNAADPECLLMFRPEL